MRAKRRSRRTAPPEPDGPFHVDVTDTARQVGLVESGAGWPQGPVAILLAFVGAVLLTGARSLWRAFTRAPGRRD